jgi:hypothetical protein
VKVDQDNTFKWSGKNEKLCLLKIHQIQLRQFILGAVLPILYTASFSQHEGKLSKRIRIIY